jgi:hypothetical protein
MILCSYKVLLILCTFLYGRVALYMIEQVNDINGL